MEKILHQILINIYDWRMWVVLICIPLLFAGSIYSCIQKRHDWGRKEIVLNMVPIWVFLLGGGLVFAHVLDGGFLRQCDWGDTYGGWERD